MSAYRLQRRREKGILIRQGQSWILLTRGEAESLARDLTNYLDDPNCRVEETNIGKQC